MVSENNILHLLFSILFLLFLFERGYFQSKAMRSSGELSKYRKKRLFIVFLVLFFILAQIWVIGSFIFILNPRLLEWTCFPIPSWIRWLSTIITVIGMVLEFSTQIYLGRNYSTFLHIQEDQSLITTGPYRYIRHPMYSALIIVAIGLVFLSASWYFGIPFLATIVVIVFRIRKEEEALIEKFGDEYLHYTQRTGRFFPPVLSRKR